MIYYPCETANGSWADRTLGVLGYDKDPVKLQALIRIVFELATSRIKIPGVHVVGIPLFEVLDGKNVSDYEQRVEPSAAGGEKMAKFILQKVLLDDSPPVDGMHDTPAAAIDEIKPEGLMRRR